MIRMRLSDAAAAVGGTLLGTDCEFLGGSTDTRVLAPGQLFIALRGARFDAHDFVREALAKGAAGALMERRATTGGQGIAVEDTRLAMGRLAQFWRRRFGPSIAAVTGSNGKTTVKEMLVTILNQTGATLGTAGNLNNDIGVPLTLFQLASSHRYAVIEMGANHPGEIAYLCGLAEPSVAVVTLCAPAHLEGFGSIEGVARAKGEIFAGLAPKGIAVINADDQYASLWREIAHPRKQLTFGLTADADVGASLLDGCPVYEGSRFILRTPSGSKELTLKLPGRHNVMNALAAATCALALEISVDNIVQGLSNVRPVQGRMEACSGPHASRIFDDTYNANPGSLKAALEVLAACPSERWLLLGDMGELGEQAAEFHRKAGIMARDFGVERLYTTGELSRLAATAFGDGAQHFPDVDALTAALNNDIHRNVTLLVKGSRAMQMDRVVKSLRAAGK